MKKRVIRIKRWVDRLSVAYEKKQWSSAMAAVDCLNAETRDLRDELCNVYIEEIEKFTLNKLMARMPIYIKTVVIALFIVMLSSLPIAVEAEKQVMTVSKKPIETNKNVKNLNWLTNEEAELLSVFRSNFAENSQMSLLAVTNSKNIKTTRTAKISEAQKTKVIPNTENISIKNKSKTIIKDTSQEDLLTLLQIGEKALKGDSFAIKVVK